MILIFVIVVKIKNSSHNELIRTKEMIKWYGKNQKLNVKNVEVVVYTTKKYLDTNVQNVNGV